MFDLDMLRVLGEVILLDLVLAGDNAIIVGMVASRVPAEHRKKVIFWGIGAAVVMRIRICVLITATQKMKQELKVNNLKACARR